MEILIRDLDKATVDMIDDIARKQHKSRNEFLKEQLTLFALAPKLRQQEERFEAVIRDIMEIIEQNTKVLKNFVDE